MGAPERAPDSIGMSALASRVVSTRFALAHYLPSIARRTVNPFPHVHRGDTPRLASGRHTCPGFFTGMSNMPALGGRSSTKTVGVKSRFKQRKKKR